ncbi:hypothetical protein B0H14DRAFT_562783 [Mycena olivaceomarginata]|nr:hypothetical protein B0H14DRAFT_562783 [Mycena olivaceomarginata]
MSLCRGYQMEEACLLLFHTTHEGLSDFTFDDYDLPWIYDLTMSSCEFLCCISFSYWASSVLIHQAPIAHHPAQHPQRRAHQHSRGGARTRTHKEQQHESKEATRRLGPRHPAHLAALHRRAGPTHTHRVLGPVASTSTLPAADECEEEDDDAWQDDDEYYAAHAGSFITLAPPLPPSFPASPFCESLPMSAALPSPRALRCESAIIPPSVSTSASTKRASVRRSPAVRASIPTRAPPPPPIVTSSGYCHSYTLAVTPASPALSRVSRTRAPPKTPLPTDALSTPWSGDWTAYAPFGTLSPSSSQHSYDSNSAYSTGSSSSERLAALLSPSPASSSPQRRFPAETQGVPSDVSSSSEWEEEDEAWEACAVSYGDTYEEVPLSPLVACVPSSPSPSSPLSPSPTEEKWSFLPSPLPLPNPAFASTSTRSAPIAGPGRYTGWHPRPRASQLRLALAVEPLSLLASQQQQQCQQEPEPAVLRSRCPPPRSPPCTPPTPTPTHAAPPAARRLRRRHSRSHAQRGWGGICTRTSLPPSRPLPSLKGTG